MLPCFICGNDASTGWIKGFVPAPDSQKLALCAEHDNAPNRLAVANVWREMLKKDIAGQMAVARHKAVPVIQTATVRFTAGGMLSFLCTACAPTEQETLRIDHPDGERTFIPMRHVREYSVRPYIQEEAEAGKTPSGAPLFHSEALAPAPIKK